MTAVLFPTAINKGLSDLKKEKGLPPNAEAWNYSNEQRIPMIFMARNLQSQGYTLKIFRKEGRNTDGTKNGRNALVFWK